MLRLLWKEWKETRLLLLALLVAPAVMMLMRESCGFVTRAHLRDRYFMNAALDAYPWLAQLVAAVWAATRAQEELRCGAFSLLRLPLERWWHFAVKFLPGLIALPLTAACAASAFCLIAPWRFHSPPAMELLFAGAVLCFGRLLVVYCLTFALSLLSNAATATMVGLLGGVAVLMWKRCDDHAKNLLDGCYRHCRDGLALVSSHRAKRAA